MGKIGDAHEFWSVKKLEQHFLDLDASNTKEYNMVYMRCLHAYSL